MTRDQLQANTKKTLIDLARQQGILGWHGMTKDELVEALIKRLRPTGSRKTSTSKPASSRRSRKPVSRSRVVAPLQAAAARDTSSTPSAETQVE
ncbi:MAG TPA: hypothetical protein VN688_12605, partial [Gemmataceae bacterium]|nr:hypothetical protein [Gemmataceae bacterium]